MARLSFIIIFIFILFPVVISEADIYRYADEKGVINFTDNKDNIPKKYKDKIKTIETDELPEATVPFPKIEDMPFPASGLSFDSPLTWIAIAVIATIAVPFLLYKFIRNKAIRNALGVIILGTIYVAMFSLYIQKMLIRSNILEELKKIQALSVERANTINKIMNDEKTGEKEIMDKIKDEVKKEAEKDNDPAKDALIQLNQK